MTIQVREHATLTTDPDQAISLDVGVVSQATFDWLLDLHQQWSGKAMLMSVEGGRRIKLGSYVGFLQSPSGEGIEILPKTEIVGSSDPFELRSLLQNMLRSSPNLQGREAQQASLLARKQPLHEWIIGEFLQELAELVRRGLRFDYQNIENESLFLRGQLDLNRQIRQTPEKAAQFHIRYDEYNPQRRENRLLRSALDTVLKLTKNNDHWSIANTLSHQLSDIQPFSRPIRELVKWNNGKHLQSYRSIKPWVSLILESLNPHFQLGSLKGISLLFPMEKLYENYLGRCLKMQLQPGRTIKAQASSQYLLRHKAKDAIKQSQWFQLKPDFLITEGHVNYSLLDAKWKLIDEELDTSADKYNIKQADLYQMFAYGQRYLNGKGELVLIYPRHKKFQSPLPVFSFSDELRLWVIPFDLLNEKLVHGDLLSSFSEYVEEELQDH